MKKLILLLLVTKMLDAQVIDTIQIKSYKIVETKKDTVEINIKIYQAEYKENNEKVYILWKIRKKNKE